MSLEFERRFFEVCLDVERKDIMIRALDTYLDRLEKVQSSRIVTQRARWLKEEIEKMKTC